MRRQPAGCRICFSQVSGTASKMWTGSEPTSASGSLPSIAPTVQSRVASMSTCATPAREAALRQVHAMRQGSSGSAEREIGQYLGFPLFAFSDARGCGLALSGKATTDAAEARCHDGKIHEADLIRLFVIRLFNRPRATSHGRERATVLPRQNEFCGARGNLRHKRKRAAHCAALRIRLVGRAGFEPATNGLKVRCSTS